MLSHDKNMQIYDTKARIILAGKTPDAFPMTFWTRARLPVTATTDRCFGELTQQLDRAHP